MFALLLLINLFPVSTACIQTCASCVIECIRTYDCMHYAGCIHPCWGPGLRGYVVSCVSLSLSMWNLFYVSVRVCGYQGSFSSTDGRHVATKTPQHRGVGGRLFSRRAAKRRTLLLALRQPRHFPAIKRCYRHGDRRRKTRHINTQVNTTGLNRLLMTLWIVCSKNVKKIINNETSCKIKTCCASSYVLTMFSRL